MKKSYLITGLFIGIVLLQSCGGGKSANTSSDVTTGVKGSADFYDFIVEVDSNYNKIITGNPEIDKSAAAQLVNKYSDSIILKNAYVSSIKKVEQQRDETYDPTQYPHRKVAKGAEGKIAISFDIANDCKIDSNADPNHHPDEVEDRKVKP